LDEEIGRIHAGFFGTPMSGGRDVVVNNSGQLGVLASSVRYKRDIRDMGDASTDLSPRKWSRCTQK